MNKITKSLLGVISSSVLMSSSLFAADEFKAFPIFTDKDFKLNTEVALVGGHMSFDNDGLDGGVMYGVELSLDCPVFTLPGNNLLRQQFSVNQYSEDDFDVTTIEVNPYYFIDITENMVVGFGPGIGVAFADAAGEEETFFTYQVGAGVKYYMDSFLIGADFRWQGSNEKDFGSGDDVDIINTRIMGKIGYRF